MHKVLLNRFCLQVKIHAEEPLLVKEPSPSDEEGKAAQKRRKEEGEPDMLFVRIARHQRLEPHIPGSSLKGPLRAYAERMVRTIIPGGACDPFDFNNNCSSRIEKISGDGQGTGGDSRFVAGTDDGGERLTAYALSCPVCKVFGNAGLRARLEVDDAYLDLGIEREIPQPAPAIHEGLVDVPWWWDKGAWDKSVSKACYLDFRTRIAVDRFTGGVRETGPFSMEYWKRGEPFVTRFTLRNFECWQIGLLAFLLRDINEGYLKVGYGKSAGFGRIRVEPEYLTVTYYGKAAQSAKKNQLDGVGKLCGEKDRKNYCFDEQDFIELTGGIGGEPQNGLPYQKTVAVEREIPAGGQSGEPQNGLPYQKTFAYQAEEEIPEILKKAAEKWIAYAQELKEMRPLDHG